MVAVGALVAAGLTTVTALPAFAAVACQVDYTIRTQWPTGFTADMTLRNLTGGDPWNGWTLTFSWPGNQQISQPPWNAGNWSQSGQNVSISNAPWNGNVASGGNASGVGFNASYSGTNSPPTNFAINGTPCTGQQQTPQLVVSQTAVTVPEGGTATYAVRLSSAPPGNVTVTSTAGTGDANITVSGGGSLTFTPSNWQTNQNVTLAASQDTDTTNGTRTIAVSAPNMTTVNVTATEDDDDDGTQALLVTPTAVTVPEGGTATYQVSLAVAQTTSRTVTSTLGSGDTNITISSGANLTFPAGSTGPLTVTLAAAQDGDTADGVRTITVASTGLPSVTVTATENDDDDATQALVVNPTSVSVPEGGTATYQVSLAVAQTTSRTVTSTLGTGDTNITISSGANLTFPAGSTGPLTVTLAAAQDADAADGVRTITVASSGLPSVTVTATEDDDETAGQALVVTPTALSVPEGGTNSYGVRLAQPLTGTATVTVTNTAASGGDTSITVSSGATLTFNSANWNTDQPVTLAAAQDADNTNGTRNITVASSGLASVTVAATEQDDEPGGTNTYIDEFMIQYNKIKAPASGYFSPEGVPYHSIERLMVEAPDHGHETTSEAYSFYVWLEAMYGRITGDWSRFNTAWNNLEQFIIPSSGFQSGGYNATDPADYAPEFNQPSQYPAPLDANIPNGDDPLFAELQSTYGNAAVYAMHWLLDVDNVYGFGQAVSSTANCRDSTARVVYINTYQRGPQESVWETVAHPSCETFAWGRQNNGGFLPIFIGGDYAQQWRFTAAPDADARAIEATYWAWRWASEQGGSAVSTIQPSIDKARKMGDYLRYAFYDKYFKQLGCATPSCPGTTGKAGMTGLLSWYFAWGGALDNAWSWRIGSSHNHGGYQNPLAAWAMSTSGPTAMRPQSPTAGADWATSTTRQLQFIRWLQASNGAIAGGATNSWDGAYAARPNAPQFFGMSYDVDPVYHDPPSNQWFGFQAWGMSRVAEYYLVTGDANAKTILDGWVQWAVNSTTLGTGSSYSIPSTLSWSGAPSGNFSSTTGMPPANTGLSVSIVDRTNDVGPAAALARTLLAYAARDNAGTALSLSAKNTAKGLLDRMLMLKDSVGIGVPEQRNDYNRFDDVWSSSNSQGLFIPSGYSGTMPNGNTIQPGSTFLSTRTFLQNEPGWASVQAYLNGTGPAPTFTYHRFWAQVDFALALADFGHMFPNG
jgi:hypothetical protein